MHVTPVVRLLFAGLLFVCTTVLLAQDHHLSIGSTSNLYARSTFAHGYIHGYEQGFHCGDLDLQLGRDPHDPSSIPSFKKPFAAYRLNQNSRALFKSGYQDGFLAGYSDAVHGLAFRAVDALRHVADGLAIATQSPLIFDEGFRDGYEAGRRQGANDGREVAVSNPINPPCLGLPVDYCDAFRRGFELGYGDGYHNQFVSPVPAAKNLQASAK